MSYLLVFGMGYSAAEIAKRLRGRNWTVVGTCRTPESAKAIAELDCRALPFDGRQMSADLAMEIVNATHLLVSVPPGEAGDPVLSSCGPVIAQAPNIRWIGYLSTIGVYGDHKGNWVDETTIPAPVSQRSKARLDAERGWATLAGQRGAGLDIFRLAGIYGPGRCTLDRLRAGEKLVVSKPGQVFNRIHVEDIAQAVEKAIERPDRDGKVRIFNVCDDAPAAPEEVAAFAAELLGIDSPPVVPFGDAKLSDMALSFYSENKRVRNGRMKQELGVVLTYPTYREGLRAIAELADEPA